MAMDLEWKTCFTVYAMMRRFLKHREYICVAIVGMVVFAILNIVMLQYHYDVWTNPKVGFWSAFFNRFEISGFDSYTYIMVSEWRPLYTLSRHPILAAMIWPLAEVNAWLTQCFGINCAIFVVAVAWGAASLVSWMLMYSILRKIVLLGIYCSMLLTAYFYSFSHVMLTAFVPDHMTLTLPVLLLTLYLSGKAMREKKVMALWKMLVLAFVSTGITTTNIVKVGIAETVMTWRRVKRGEAIRRLVAFSIPLVILGALYLYQENTTQRIERERAERTVQRRAARDSIFARKIEESKNSMEIIRKNQIIPLSIVTNTEYHIDRIPSVVENIFGEGIILHEDYLLMDANKSRPVLVRYRHWGYYAVEALVVLLFIVGAWMGRRNRMMVAGMMMFAFDMLLHVGLNFASADVYIMTAHWAFVMPLATAFLIKETKKTVILQRVVISIVTLLTLFLWIHNARLIVQHIMGI